MENNLSTLSTRLCTKSGRKACGIFCAHYCRHNSGDIISYISTNLDIYCYPAVAIRISVFLLSTLSTLSTRSFGKNPRYKYLFSF
ncbi:hypothetical protein BRYFOR_05272 [Marvinbryantia formatexigens DSM 14469]|uniref:Uncharacterized protein n=1 Tax=Marvinbryantia formatexigens DSM 14469 TaxID=478749 RepID=C6L9I2_9FIRM|nr:hypothetical protein BRYFOR_05272 [Marvinbryantia formatexigens DSM 14469]